MFEQNVMSMVGTLTYCAGRLCEPSLGPPTMRAVSRVTEQQQQQQQQQQQLEVEAGAAASAGARELASNQVWACIG
jgi:hypothetical protein